MSTWISDWDLFRFWDLSTLPICEHFRCWLPMSVPQFLSIFCPLSRICPFPVHFLSPFCPSFVLVPFLSPFCHKNSNFCPKKLQFLSACSCPVPFLSYLCHHFLLRFYQKLLDKNWTEMRPNYFRFYHLVTLYLNKSWTIIGLMEILSLSTFCPGTAFRPKILYITVFRGWT